MPHDTPLIATIVIGLSLAFALGAAANRIRISPIVGYLAAGIAVGPFTPGFVADQGLANELAEIGIILLMFGVGLHFSLRDLLSVRAVAIPGALVQIACATGLGVLLGQSFGWPLGTGLVFGLALSVASTVVLLRALQERHMITSEQGRIAVGWLIVEDLVMVMALVALPAVAPLLNPDANGPTTPEGIATTLGLTLIKVIAFFAVMMVIGRRVIPAILHYIAYTGSRELFRLGVLTIALGVAFVAAKVFGVSFALGAFFAGMILSESQLSQQAANESLPLRDAFAVLFFISVGMMFNPSILIEEWAGVLLTLAIILIGKSIAALLIVRAFGYPWVTGFWISASLAQIGEFSFILASLGVTLDLLPTQGRELILAGALLSIMLNPVFFFMIDKFAGGGPDIGIGGKTSNDQAPDATSVTNLTGHVVLVGFGRVGSIVGEKLIESGTQLLVIEDKEETAQKLKERHVETIAANAVKALKRANLSGANQLVVAIPDCFEAGQILAQARALRPDLFIVARAHSDAEADYLRAHGASEVVQGARKTADAMLAHIQRGTPETPKG